CPTTMRFGPGWWQLSSGWSRPETGRHDLSRAIALTFLVRDSGHDWRGRTAPAVPSEATPQDVDRSPEVDGPRYRDVRPSLVFQAPRESEGFGPVVSPTGVTGVMGTSQAIAPSWRPAPWGDSWPGVRLICCPWPLLQISPPGLRPLDNSG